MAAAIALGYALQLTNGNLHPDSIHLVTAALLLALAAAVGPRWSRLERAAESALVALLGGGLAFQFGKLLTTPPGYL